MGTITPLKDRINSRKIIELHKTPRWIERMQANKLQAKDLTGWRPSPDAA